MRSIRNPPLAAAPSNSPRSPRDPPAAWCVIGEKLEPRDRTESDLNLLCLHFQLLISKLPSRTHCYHSPFPPSSSSPHYLLWSHASSSHSYRQMTASQSGPLSLSLCSAIFRCPRPQMGMPPSPMPLGDPRIGLAGHASAVAR